MIKSLVTLASKLGKEKSSLCLVAMVLVNQPLFLRSWVFLNLAQVKPLFSLKVWQTMCLRCAKIAYLPESATLYPHLNAVENLRYFLDLADVKCDEQQISTALDRVSLDVSARSKPLEKYFKGMRQKTAIALALLRDTPILLLDEPTSGLDPVAIDEFNRLISDLASAGKTILGYARCIWGVSGC